MDNENRVRDEDVDFVTLEYASVGVCDALKGASETLRVLRAGNYPLINRKAVALTGMAMEAFNSQKRDEALVQSSEVLEVLGRAVGGLGNVVIAGDAIAATIPDLAAAIREACD